MRRGSHDSGPPPSSPHTSLSLDLKSPSEGWVGCAGLLCGHRGRRPSCKSAGRPEVRTWDAWLRGLYLCIWRALASLPAPSVACLPTCMECGCVAWFCASALRVQRHRERRGLCHGFWTVLGFVPCSGISPRPSGQLTCQYSASLSAGDVRCSSTFKNLTLFVINS